MTLPFHPLANLFPLIEGAEFDELCASIRANGLRDPITVHDGMVLDGRNRQRACEVAEVDCIYAPLPSDDDPLEYVLDKNIRRRHLTTGQKAFALAEYETLRHGGARKVQDANLQLEPESQTRAELAEKAGVSERSIASAAVVRDHGVEDLKVAVRQGGIAVSAAEKIARLPEPEQPAAVAKHLPNGARSIMGSRQEPDDSLDFFPTPPWATRALVEVVFPQVCNGSTIGRGNFIWEPACGDGHIAEVLREYCGHVYATDVFDYGYGDVLDFLDHEIGGGVADWVITNPPFGDSAIKFVTRGLGLCGTGIAMFFRSQWAVEGIERYKEIFRDNPPTLCAFFVERVNLCKGRWDPEGSTATAYCWLVWVKDEKPQAPFWIPPGQREALTRPDDAERFTAHPVIKRKSRVADDGSPTDSITGEITDGERQEGNPGSSSAMVETPQGMETGVLEKTEKGGTA